MVDSPCIKNPEDEEVRTPVTVRQPVHTLTMNTPAISPVSFSHALSIKLDDKNFLLWCQQVEGVIAAHRLHRFVVNPIIPLKYASEDDMELDLMTDVYQKWLVQDQMLFTWLLSSLSEFVLPRVIGCRHAWQLCDTIHKFFSLT